MEQKLRIFAQGVTAAAGDSAVFETVRSDHVKQIAVKVRCSKIGEASDYVFVNSSTQEVSIPENGVLKKAHYLGDVFRCEQAQTDYQPEDILDTEENEDSSEDTDTKVEDVQTNLVLSAGPITPEMLKPLTQQEKDDLENVLGNRVPSDNSDQSNQSNEQTSEEDDLTGESAEGAEDEDSDEYPDVLNLPEGASIPSETPQSLENVSTNSLVALTQEQHRGGKKNKSRK